MIAPTERMAKWLILDVTGAQFYIYIDEFHRPAVPTEDSNQVCPLERSPWRLSPPQPIRAFSDTATSLPVAIMRPGR